MKFIKPLFIALLAMVVMFAAVVPSFAQADPSGSVSVKAGDEITLQFKYDDVAGIEGTITYSNVDLFTGKPVLAVEGFSAGSYNEESGKLAYYITEAGVVDGVITVTVTIASTAKVGDTCTVTLAYETSVDGVLSKLQQDVVVLTVVDPGSVDYSRLIAAMQSADAKDEKLYTTSTWKALKDAYAAAEEALKSLDQGVVDAATDALLKAIDGLREWPDYSKLLALIAKAEGLEKDKYTAESWANLERALDAARAALNAEDQATVDAAFRGLEDAIAVLENPPTADKAIVIFSVTTLLFAVVSVMGVLTFKNRKKISE